MARRIIAWILGLAAVLALALGIGGFLVLRAFVEPDRGAFGTLEDEAKRAGLQADHFRAAADPWFAGMDKGLLEPPAPGAAYPPEILQIADATGLAPEAVRLAAIRGQNAWIVWTGGNDRFWDFAAANTAGAFDLLKIVSSHPAQAYGRPNRFRWLGVVNEPCFEKPTGPDPARYGLWLDHRREEGAPGRCAPDPFANPKAYPGVEIGARGGNVPVGSYYGEPSGVIGLRLFPNPEFDEAAARRWDPVRYYTDPDYYNDLDLVRPYRVGMSCAFCHVGPNPVKPPANPEAPDWSELTSNPGAQYFWVERIFFWNTQPRREPGVPAPNEANFLYQLFHTNPPGSLDTSLVSSDYMNNPRTMNAVYETAARLGLAARQGIEQLEGDERDNRQFQDFPQTASLAGLFDGATGRVASMRVLKDGADSVGTLGALNRVYLNIGLFSEEWLLHFRPFLGGQKISPIRIADAQRNSTYWNATEAMTADMAIFFLVTARADRLRDAPGGARILDAEDPVRLAEGRRVFAENCAGCHSSKQPVPDPSYGVDLGLCAGGGAGPRYRECWDRYWAWAQSDEFRAGMRAIVEAPDFLAGNYLSTERRVPMDLLGTNACSAIATNGLAGDIWNDFTSASYKLLPPPKEVTVNHPVSGAAMPFQAPGNGRGYLRPASLVGLWSTAPYLLNNSMGHDADYDRETPYENPRAYMSPYDAVEAAPGALDHAEEGAATPLAAPAATPAITPAAPAPLAATPAGAGSGAYPGPYPGGGPVAAHADAGAVSCPAADPDDPYLPCVENRLRQFDKSIRQMLWPGLRRVDMATAEPVPGYIYRTSAPACLMVPKGFVPKAIRDRAGLISRIAPWAMAPDGTVRVGPFPEGFPINALLNTKLLPDNDEPDMAAHLWRMAKAGPTLIAALKGLGGRCSPGELADPAVIAQSEAVVRETGLIDTLVGLSKCPDYVVNRGHLFGTGLSDAEKEALIAFLREF